MTTAYRVRTGGDERFTVPGTLANAPEISWEKGPRALYEPDAAHRLRSGDLQIKLPTSNPTYPDAPAGRVRTFFDDYYNRIYLEPADIDVGFRALANDLVVPVTIWNAYYNRDVTLSHISYQESDGLFVDGSELPRTIRRLGTARYEVIAYADRGPAQLNTSIQWVFNWPIRISQRVTGMRSKAWTFPPSWPPTGKNYQIAYTYKTEIISSHSGREQRIALRTSPRKTLEHRVLLQHDTLRQFQDLMRSSQARMLIAPEITRFVETTGVQEAGTQEMVVDHIPPWIVPGAALYGSYHGMSEIRVLEEVDGQTLRFQSAATEDWPVGTKVHPALSGYVATELSVPRVTNAVAQLDLRFDVAPLSEPVVPPPAAPHTFNGRELFLKRPNWARPVTQKIGHDVHELDFGRGPVSRFTPVAYGYETYQAQYLNRNAEEAQYLVDLFCRMRGQQGEFYMPTWEYDFKPTGLVSGQSTGMIIEGQDFARAYENSTVCKAVFVVLGNGDLIFRKVTSIEIAEEDSVLRVDEVWGVDFTADSIVMCGWMPVRRLASDNLTVEWVTNSVAQVMLNMVTLEDLPPETA